MRHRARLGLCDLGVGGRVDDRHRRRDHLAVEVEVHDERIQSVRGDVDRRREVAEVDAAADEGVWSELVLPVLAVRRAVAGGHVEVVADDLESVGAFHLGRRLADADSLLDLGAPGAESNPMNQVGRFSSDVDPVGRGWRVEGGGWRLRLRGGCRRGGALRRGGAGGREEEAQRAYPEAYQILTSWPALSHTVSPPAARGPLPCRQSIRPTRLERSGHNYR
jgi:hypothetical protein